MAHFLIKTHLSRYTSLYSKSLFVPCRQDVANQRGISGLDNTIHRWLNPVAEVVIEVGCEHLETDRSFPSLFLSVL